MTGERPIAWIFAAIAAIALIGLLTILRSKPTPERQQENHQLQAAKQGVSANLQPHSDTKKQTETELKYYKKRNLWERFVSYIEARDKFFTSFGTIVVALFTVSLAFATFLLYIATKNLVEDAKENAGRQLRAYVILSEGHYHNGAGEFLTGHVGELTFKNLGQTPAHELVAYWTISRNPQFGADQAENLKGDTESTVLAPQGVLKFDIPLEDFDAIPIENRTKPNREYLYFIRGYVKYKDIFEVDQTTKFSLDLLSMEKGVQIRRRRDGGNGAT